MPDAGGGILVGAHLPPGVPEPGAQLGSHVVGPLALGQSERVLVIDETALPEQPGLGERIEVYQDPWPEPEGAARARAVRFALDDATHLEHDVSDGE